MDEPDVAARIFDLVGNGTFVFQLLITSDFARPQLIKNQLFNLRVRQIRHRRKIVGGGGVDILLGATVGIPVSGFFVGPRVGGIFVASGATFVAREGGVADGCTSDSSVKRQVAKTSNSTNSDVITFIDISLIPPVAHSICQLPTHESQSFTQSYLTNHTTIYLVA